MSPGFATRAVHGGQPDDEGTGAVTFPIYQTSTYAQSAPGVHRGFCYSRTGNPTRTALEENLAGLENARYGLAFASGLAAVNGLLSILRAGDHVVALRDLYGGTYRLFTKLYRKFGVEFTFVDEATPAALEGAFRGETKVLWLETPSNPLLRVTDLKAAAAVARGRGVLTAADNTFATPYLQRPLELGADVVVHSTTKYLAGHSDVIGGALVTDDPALFDELRFFQNAVGAIPGPQDCFLVLRGTKTLALRMDRHCESARAVAGFLGGRSEVARVHYPGLSCHPGHEVARAQMRDFGGVVSFELDGGEAAARAFLGGLRLWTLGESLGSVKSLVCQPATMTHASVEPDVRRAAGIGDGLIRLSAGVEDPEDLLADLERALREVEAVTAPAPARRTARTG
jgi:cystathionine gamma-lyase